MNPPTVTVPLPRPDTVKPPDCCAGARNGVGCRFDDGEGHRGGAPAWGGQPTALGRESLGGERSVG